MSNWIGDDRATLAVERLLDAAGQAFATLGVAATNMADIAELAGCSRATLYRYFPNRDELRTAFVNREAVRVAATVGELVAAIDDPAERLSTAILSAVDLVRSTPTLAVWFESDGQGTAATLAGSSEVIAALSHGFLGGVARSSDGHDLDGRWLVRCIVSLLTMPGADPAEERRLVERHVVPSLLA